MARKTRLIVGLGNPGKKYEDTWHNLGFSVLDKLAEEKFRKSVKFQAETAEKTGKEKIILAKPLAFMNNSGVAVKTLMKFHRIAPSDLIVIHDDLDLPLGKIRIVSDSSAGGHNGVSSIIKSLGTKKFTRVKIGIKTDKLEKTDPADYVLEKTGKKKILSEVADKAIQAIEIILENSVESAMNKFN